MRSDQYWHELSECERRAIRDKRDCPIIAVIKGMPNSLKQTIYKELNYLPSSNPNYLTGERPWIEDFGQYLWEKEFFESSIPIDYRLYYAAKNPILVNHKNKSRELSNFLIEIGEVTNGEFGNLPLLAG
jgi:hypothetical protein